MEGEKAEGDDPELGLGGLACLKDVAGFCRGSVRIESLPRSGGVQRVSV